MARELGNQPRLADAGIAADQEQPAAPTLCAGLGQRRELAQLLVAADAPARRRRRRIHGGRGCERDHRLAATANIERVGRVADEQAATCCQVPAPTTISPGPARLRSLRGGVHACRR